MGEDHFHLGGTAVGLCQVALGLIGGDPFAGFSAAGLPVRALVFGHGLFLSVELASPPGPSFF